MFFIGGVTNGAGRISFTCSDADLTWVIQNTQEAWQGCLKGDALARFFVAPLAASAMEVPVLDLASLEAPLREEGFDC